MAYATKQEGEALYDYMLKRAKLFRGRPWVDRSVEVDRIIDKYSPNYPATDHWRECMERIFGL